MEAELGFIHVHYLAGKVRVHRLGGNIGDQITETGIKTLQRVRAGQLGNALSAETVAEILQFGVDGNGFLQPFVSQLMTRFLINRQPELFQKILTILRHVHNLHSMFLTRMSVLSQKMSPTAFKLAFMSRFSIVKRRLGSVIRTPLGHKNVRPGED
ncbi:MAG: hypothetical protein IJM79_08960 [Erysipelotrichaceae bacterium]|nr:hypothetical protein [Erysipelotrichaceae bacterium]